MSVDRVEMRLSELRARTDGLRARPGFQARVMRAVAQSAAHAFGAELTRAARWFVPAALAVTLVSVGWASHAERATSDDVLQAELSWELSR